MGRPYEIITKDKIIMPIPFQSEAVTHRQFLRYQIELERAIDKLHKDTERALDKIIARNTNMAGTVDRHKIKKILDTYMAKEMSRYRKELQSQVKVGVADSAKIGIKSIIGAVAPHRKITSLIWKNTARRIRKRITKMRGVDGLTLSERIWKVSGDGMHHLKKIVASDILSGDSAAKISRDIRGLLLQPETLRGRAKDLLHPGTGTYKSAYKNAMRVTRTETANAYLYGQVDTAKEMGYKIKWQLSWTHKPTGCQCETYAGNIYKPEDVPERPHPQCMCYMLSVPA